MVQHHWITSYTLYLLLLDRSLSIKSMMILLSMQHLKKRGLKILTGYEGAD